MKSNSNCVQRTNIQNLKAIHNTLQSMTTPPRIVFKERIYKIWKQFTTGHCWLLPPPLLCSKNEYTKSESNSQHPRLDRYYQRDCVQRTNIQNLKAIHNTHYDASWYPWLCSKNEYTKSESNSQHTEKRQTAGGHCVQRTNIQNLKAIHNRMGNDVVTDVIVFKERIYKIWKQFTTSWRGVNLRGVLCSKNEYTKSESNSQRIAVVYRRSQNCVQRTNIQNLKAIHNTSMEEAKKIFIVFKEQRYYKKVEYRRMK